MNDQTTMQDERSTSEQSRSTVGFGALLIAWWRERRRKQNILRLQKMLWAANYIVISERHGFHSKENKEFHTELESCSDQLELTICKLKKHIDVPNVKLSDCALLRSPS